MPINYKEIAERMQGDACHRGCDISVLVEDYSDERFWECMLETVKPELKDKIDFPSPCSKGTRGTSILKKYKDYVKSNFIICVDSDSEHLYNDDAWYRSDFVFDTIFYSKENFQCHHVALNEVCKDLTGKTYDFESLFEKISKIIADVFCFWLHFGEIGRKNFITNEVFEEILDFNKMDFDEIKDEHKIIEIINEKTTEVLDSLKVKMNTEWDWYGDVVQNQIPNIKLRLVQKSVQKEDLLLHCYGHAVFDKFVEPFMRKLIELLKNERIEEVRRELSHASGNNLDNTIQRIENISQQNIGTKLTDSFKYLIYNPQYSDEIQAIKIKLQNSL